jgi:Ca2+-binding EF-hand superfamily protein
MSSDFGLSKHFTFGVCETQAVGTPYTVAPEVIKGSYDEKCDIWAIGVIAYLLLSGETPFGGVDGEDLMQVRSNILRGSLKFEPAEVWNNVSEFGKDFVRSALNLDPSSRPTAKQAQRHDWLQTYSKLPKDDPGSKLNPHVVNALVAFKEYSDMRKLLCEVVSFTLLPEQINDLRVEFEKIDNGKGEISLTDLKMVLLESARSVGGMSEREVEDVFNALRVRKTEPKIHWHEFIAAGLSQCKIDERNLKLAFDRIDTDRKGFITFDNVMNLVGDASENKGELKLMWMESAKHVQGDLDRITVDDFLLIMKGQALGEQSESFRTDKRRSIRPLDIVIEGETSPQISRMTTDFGVFDTASSALNDHLMPHLTLGDAADSDVAIMPRRGLTVDTAAPGSTDMRSYMKLRSRSLEHNKTKYFEGVDEDAEDDDDELPQRPSVLLPPWSKKAIETVRGDETKTSLMVNRAMYRAHRELRLAVMECSKRFEENRRRRELEAKVQDLGQGQHPGPAIGLVMRRGYRNANGLDGSTWQESDDVELEQRIAENDALKKSAERDALLHASVRSGRPRTRTKTVSDMTGMFGPP